MNKKQTNFDERREQEFEFENDYFESFDRKSLKEWVNKGLMDFSVNSYK